MSSVVRNREKNPGSERTAIAVTGDTPRWQHIARITWAGPEAGFQFTGFEATERGYTLNPGNVAAAFNAIAWTLDQGSRMRSLW